MNKQTEQLKRRLHQKIEAIQDTEYLASLDAIVTWETTRESTNSSRFSVWRWVRTYFSRNRSGALA